MKKHKLNVSDFDVRSNNPGDNALSPAAHKPQCVINKATKLIIMALSCALIGALNVSASTTVTFEGMALNTPLSDVPTWTVTTPNNAPEAPFSWITEYDSGGTLSKAAAIGGFFDAPASSTYTATVGASTPVSGALIAFDVGIFDSSNLYPDRDTFGFSVNALGGSLMTASFTPIAQTLTPENLVPPGLWQLSYTFRGGSAVNTGFALSEAAIYNMQLSFLAGSVSFTVNDGLTALAFSGVPSGYSFGTEVISGISYDWKKSTGISTYGDNYMIVDNIQGIPEPGRMMLLGLGSLSLLFRRQRRA